MNREPIYSALFTRLSGIAGLKTKSRILKHWNDVPPEQRPALFMSQGSETPTTVTGEPQKWLLMVDVYVYVHTDGTTPPGSVLNPILDAIEAIFPLHPITGKHTLDAPGVEWARIEGQIQTDEGTLGHQAMAVVPIQILATGGGDV